MYVNVKKIENKFKVLKIIEELAKNIAQYTHEAQKCKP